MADQHRGPAIERFGTTVHRSASTSAFTESTLAGGPATGTFLQIGGTPHTMLHTSQRLFAAASLGLFTLFVCFGATLPSNQLAQLLKTNAPCRVRLQPLWTGVAEPTVRTGFFTNANSPEYEKFMRELRFDWFTYDDKPSRFHFGPRTISRSAGHGGETAICTYHTNFPTDTVIQACTTIGALTNLLGPPQGFHDGAPFSAGWSYFMLTPTNTIMTLSIFSMRRELDGKIDDLVIRRGVVREER